MSRAKYLVPALIAGLVGMAWIGTALAQERGPGGGGGYNPEAARERMMARYREALRASDEQWKNIEPRLDAVLTLQRQIRPGMGRLFARGGPPAAAPGAPEPTAVEKAADALNAVLDKADSTPEQIAAALKAFRDARDAATKDLAKAQEELQKVATPAQAARLVLLGVLD